MNAMQYKWIYQLSKDDIYKLKVEEFIMGINYYLLDRKTKAYCDFGTGMPIIPKTFYEYRDKAISIDMIPEYIMEYGNWVNTDIEYITKMGLAIESFIESADEHLIMFGDDIYSDLLGNVDIVDVLFDKYPDLNDWHGRRNNNHWNCVYYG